MFMTHFSSLTAKLYSQRLNMSHLSCDNSTKPQLFQTYQTETSSSSFQTTCNLFYTMSFESIFYPIPTAVKKIIDTCLDKLNTLKAHKHCVVQSKHN